MVRLVVYAMQETHIGSVGTGAQAEAYLCNQEGLFALKENLRKDHVLHIRLCHQTWNSVSLTSRLFLQKKHAHANVPQANITSGMPYNCSTEFYHP